MKSMCLVAVVAGIVLTGSLMSGCASPNYLVPRTNTARVQLPADTLPASTPGASSDETPGAGSPMMGDTGTAGGTTVANEEKETGTWTFTTPATVTRVEKRTGEISQISLYAGRPGPKETPFVVITVAPDNDTAGQAASDPALYTVINTRDYVLNGNVAKEWTGRTRAGGVFCELLIKKATGKGDICHAMAVARNDAQRKEALAILGSIAYKTE